MSSIRWLAFYGEIADDVAFDGYQIVILDRGYRGSITKIGAGGARVCSYLSLCEIRTGDPLFYALHASALLEPNPDWPGTRRVDVRHSSWRSFILDTVIPSIEAAGFDGLMLDTLDTATYLESTDPERYRGMRAAAIALVDTIRDQHPHMTVIMNRGYDLLADLAPRIDAVIVESLLTVPDGQGHFVLADPDAVARERALLAPAARRRPPLPILSLDYWDPGDRKMIAELYRRERAFGHHPYVATRLLDSIVPEPS
ncbi:endo alpha-1,4 polygalactosaminidase [Bradyrhizobium sp. HKCCYLS2038]|uniref:endo alpha-1,4 polygalactosaminidase n=1 Tax=unclassified Bradyrhizobium TaxID=2631580 RepID=UPI003EBD2004